MPQPSDRPTSADRIRAATWFAEHGFGVFSVWSAREDGSCRCPKGRSCDNAGKHPITPRGFHDATTDTEQIRKLLDIKSEPNYGLVCPDNVFALDVDGTDLERLADLETRLGPLPATLRTETANGVHIFLHWPEGRPRPQGKLFGFVTRFGDTGYVIGPRSVHASGKTYVPSGTTEIAEIPPSWVEASIQNGHARIKIGAEELPSVGNRHDWLRDRARFFAGVIREPSVLKAAVMAENARLPQPKTEEEVDRAIGEVLKRFPPDPVTRVEPNELQIDAADLVQLDIPPLTWIVPDLLPEGTAVLAAPPKIGKSSFVYQAAVEIALGGELLGRRVLSGSVLYLALEDGRRRGKERLNKALAGRTMPYRRLTVQWGANKIGKGLEDDLDRWLDDHPDACLVAVDTLQKVRASQTGKRGAYEVDVEDLGRLQDLFRDRPVALLVVHHTRKDAGEDFLSAVSGTYGITGSVDTTLVIDRRRHEAAGKIVVTGRDVPEYTCHVDFTDGIWTESDAISHASFKQREIYEWLEENGPAWPKAIADALGSERSSVNRTLARMAQQGLVTETNQGYRVNAVKVNVGSRVLSVPSDEPSRAPARPRVYVSPSTHSTHSTDDTLEQPFDSAVSAVSAVPYVHAGVRAREGEWLHRCYAYSAHQSAHRQTAAGWTCDICYPQEEVH